MLNYFRKPKIFRKNYPKFNNRTQFGIFTSRKSIGSKVQKSFHKYLRRRFR